jgi:hypothetical protein
MTKIRFHRVDNQGWGRYHAIWFKKFSKYLEQYFEVEWKDYYDPNNQVASARLEMQSEIGSFGYNPPLSDVDCVIENLDTKQFIVLTFTEYFNSYVVHYLKSPFCQKLLTAHYSNQNTYYWLKRDNVVHQLDKVSPWFFGSIDEWDINKYRNIRNETPETEYNDTIFWKGSGIGSYRKVIQILSDKRVLDTQTMPFDIYMETLAKQKVALAYYMDLDRYNTPYDYPGEFCYRDMEYCALGVPFIRIEYKDNVYDGLYPNKHYISIPREKAYSTYDKEGDEGVANLIIEKFNEVKDDRDLLRYISANQKEWFDKYAMWPHSAEFAMKLTGVDKWI